MKRLLRVACALQLLSLGSGEWVAAAAVAIVATCGITIRGGDRRAQQFR